MDGAGVGSGLLARPAVVGVDDGVHHDAGGVGVGFGAICNGCYPRTTPSSSSSSLGSNSGFGGSTSSSSSSTMSSSDLMDDATSPSVRPSPLCEMNALMANLPIKRGLSQHFQGKSQSFTSLAAVASVEDLAKPARAPWRQSSSRKGAAARACKTKSSPAGLDHGHGFAPPISPIGRVISKSKKHYPSLARRSSGGGGGLWGAAAVAARMLLPAHANHQNHEPAAAAAGMLLPAHAHHQKHGPAAAVCVGRHQQHALLFA